VTGPLSVLYLTQALDIHPSHYITRTSRFSFNELHTSILLLHKFIFCSSCDVIQWRFLFSFIFHCMLDPEFGTTTLLFDFFSNPQRSQHHALDNQIHSSTTERCFSYIINRRLAYFPGIHRWAKKSRHMPWLCRRRKPKGVLTDVNSQFRWRQNEHIGCNKKLEPFWGLILALKYLPYLLHNATRSEELIALAKMWSNRPFLLSLFPHDAKKAGRAVKQYLDRSDGKEQCERVAVRPPLLCIV